MPGAHSAGPALRAGTSGSRMLPSLDLRSRFLPECQVDPGDGLDRVPLERPTWEPVPAHEHMRGAAYYQSWEVR